MKTRVAVALLIGILSVPAFAARRDDGGDRGGFFAKLVTKIVHALDDIRMGPPLP